jgi:hypothetical protein
LQSQGHGWPRIAKSLRGRTADQICERFNNHLDPNRNNAPWTEEEDRILMESQHLLGNKWAEITKFLPGRSKASIKNRWHNGKTKHRRSMRQLVADKKHRSSQDAPPNRENAGGADAFYQHSPLLPKL